MRVLKYLSLKPGSISEYIGVHDNIPPQIVEGILSVGITKMDLYLYQNHAVMLLECPDELDVEAAMAKLATLPGQEEWENLVSLFQECQPGDTSSMKWHPMNRIFSLHNSSLS